MPGRGVYWKVDGSNKTGVAFEQLDSALQGQVSGGGSGGHVIQDEGTGLPQEPILDFVGAGVTVTDGSGKTIVTIPSGTGLEILDTALLQEEFYWRELQGGGVVKLFETTTQTLANSILATINPAVNFADYSEFWLVVSGKLETQDDIFFTINSITSTSYETFGSFDDQSTAGIHYAFTGQDKWTANPVLDQTTSRMFYFKAKIWGGALTGVGNSRGGLIEGHFQIVTNTLIHLKGYLLAGGVSQSTLSELRVFTNSANFSLGTKVAVYGVSPIQGAFRQKYNVTGFIRPEGEDIQDLGVIKLETPGVNGAGFAGVAGDPSSIDTGKVGGGSPGFEVTTITRRNITMKQVLTVIDSVGSMVVAGMVETTPKKVDNLQTEAGFLALQDNGFGFIFSPSSTFWRIWTKRGGALTIQTTTVAPTNGIDVRQTLEAKIILQGEGDPIIEYRIDGVLVGTLTTNDPQSNALIMYSGVFGTGVLTTTKELDIDTWEVQVDRVLTAPV